MADEGGKLKGETDRPGARQSEDESAEARPGGKYALREPWTEDHERWFQIMMREFGGGHAGRDADL